MLAAVMDAAASFLIASPSKTCKVRVSASRYRNDPYRARVLPRMSPASPSFAKRLYVPPATVLPVTSTLAAPLTFAQAAASRPAADSVLPPVAPKLPPAAVQAAPVAASPAPQTSPATHFALIGFKHETAMYQAPFRVAVGDVVVVEADRGEHIGVVQQITTTKPAYPVPSRVLRRANGAEMGVIEDLTAKEQNVTAVVQKLAESLGLGIRVVDTEFQMDGNKLTVFFASKVFVDFRKLQRALFRDFRCRIWLVNWAEVRAYTPVPVNPAPEARFA